MKIFVKVIVLFSIVFLFSYGFSYGIDNRRDMQPQIPSPGQGAPPQPPKSVGPSGMPGAAPSVSTTHMPPVEINRGGMMDIPTPIINSANGKVVEISSDSEKWIKINDDLFGTDIKINISDLSNQKTNILKNGSIAGFSDIKVGDVISVIYTNDASNTAFTINGAENNTASLIQILSEEDIKLMGFNKSGLIMVPGEPSEGAGNAAEEGGMPAVQSQQGTAAEKKPSSSATAPQAIKSQPATTQAAKPQIKNESKKTQEPAKKQGFFDKILDGFKNK